jgi:LemA protein
MIRDSNMGRYNVTTLIQRVYGRRYRLEPYPQVVSRPQYVVSKIEPVVGFIRAKRVRILVVILLALLAGGSIYYYNLLVQTEQDVLAARGKVAALKQRRNDISINLSKAVYDYSKHEHSVFTAVVALRAFLSENGVKGAEMEEVIKKLEQTGAAGAGTITEKISGAGPLSALNRLFAIAEQYPDLKLSSNFNSLMAALVDVEKDLATERIRYNDSANIYSTVLAKFPVNVYAWIFGFEAQPYYEATPEAKRFKPIEY